MEMDANMIEPETNQSMEMGATAGDIGGQLGMNSTNVDMAASMVMADVEPVAEVLGKVIAERVGADVLEGKGDASNNFLNAVRVGEKGGVSSEEVTAVMDEIGREAVAGSLAKVSRVRQFFSPPQPFAPEHYRLHL